jgi:hypothetical protein
MFIFKVRVSSSPSWTLRYVNKARCSEATMVEVEEPQVAMEEEMASWYVLDSVDLVYYCWIRQD